MTRRRPQQEREARSEFGSRRRGARTRPAATWRDDLITGVLALGLTIGLLLDAWQNGNRIGDANAVIMNQWHGLLITGFVGLGLWSLTRHQSLRRHGLANVPVGYGVAVAGLALGFTALIGDGMWDLLFAGRGGVLESVSPFHLGVLAASALMALAAFRSMWAKPASARVPTLKAFAPVLLSAGTVTALVLFTAKFQTPLVAWTQPGQAPENGGLLALLQLPAPVAILFTNTVLLAPVLLILRRWNPPLGTMTILLTGITVLASALTSFDRVSGVFGALLAGLAADLVIHYSSPAPRALTARRVAAVLPVVFWLTWYVAIVLFEGLAWSLGLLVMTVALASASGAGLALAVNRQQREEDDGAWWDVTPVPGHADQRDRRGSRSDETRDAGWDPADGNGWDRVGDDDRERWDDPVPPRRQRRVPSEHRVAADRRPVARRAPQPRMRTAREEDRWDDEPLAEDEPWNDWDDPALRAQGNRRQHRRVA